MKSTHHSTDDDFQIIIQSSSGEHIATIDGPLATHVVKRGISMFLTEALKAYTDEQG